jgi:glucarate dehydratase
MPPFGHFDLPIAHLARTQGGPVVTIARMEVTPVAIADAPLRNAPGIHEPYVNRLIVELVSADGLSGFGEGAYSTNMHQILLKLREYIVGLDAANTGVIAQVVASVLAGDSTGDRDPVYANFSGASSTVQTLIPRVFSPYRGSGPRPHRPLARRAGLRPPRRRCRDSVPFAAYLFYKHAGGGGEGDDLREDIFGEAMSPDGIVRQAQAMIDRYGFKSVKLKGGVFPPEIEIEGIKALRAALGPDVPLRIDPNCAWTVETSIMVGQALAADLEYFEDPTGGIPGHGRGPSGVTRPRHRPSQRYQHVRYRLQPHSRIGRPERQPGHPRRSSLLGWSPRHRRPRPHLRKRSDSA